MQSYLNDPGLKEKSLDKAQQAQTLVREILELSGFTVAEVKNVSANGIDIVAIKSGEQFCIEVKTTFYTSRSWRVKKIHTKADYVFVLLPSGHLYIQDAISWRKAASIGGDRGITHIVRLYEALGTGFYETYADKLIELLGAAI